MFLDSNRTVHNTRRLQYTRLGFRKKANVIKVFREDVTVVQYCDNMKTNEEYNFISGTFILSCKLHCIQQDEDNWHLRTVHVELWRDSNTKHECRGAADGSLHPSVDSIQERSFTVKKLLR